MTARDKEQKKALKLCLETEGNILLSMATGSGKSRVPIEYAKKKGVKSIAVLVPTEDLRDNNWKEEFEKWGAIDLWENNTEALCYASASKIKGKHFDLIIMDEAHRITDLSYEFFIDNTFDKVIALTATEPEKLNKITLFEQLNFKAKHVLTLDEAIEKGIIADYEITVVYTQLNSSLKYIDAGSKKKPFKTTEKKNYDYLTSKLEELKSLPYLSPTDERRREFLILKRMHLIYNLRSKLIAAKYIKDKVLDTSERILIFCGNIDQANELCEYRYHSKTSDTDLIKFKKGEINQLSCVDAINEGINIPDLDGALVVQIKSSEIQLIQRLGRTLRIRPNHKARITILVCKGTQDEVWLENAIKNLDSNKIVYKMINEYLYE